VQYLLLLIIFEVELYGMIAVIVEWVMFQQYFEHHANRVDIRPFESKRICLGVRNRTGLTSKSLGVTPVT
jgi:hypothetical protein